MLRQDQQTTDRRNRDITILVVEDERRYRMLIADALRMQGYEVIEANDGRTALDLAAHKKINLVLLDLGLPDMDGFVVCQRLRDFIEVPVIIVSGRGEDQDKVRGLDGGAEDYLTKPFSVAELLARVRVVLRRFLWQPASGASLQFGDLHIDGQTHSVMLGMREIPLTRTEFRLLWLLAMNAGCVLVPAVIAERVWNASGSNADGVLRTTITRLREKLGDDPTNPTYIHTRRGIGYVFMP